MLWEESSPVKENGAETVWVTRWQTAYVRQSFLGNNPVLWKTGTVSYGCCLKRLGVCYKWTLLTEFGYHFNVC